MKYKVLWIDLWKELTKYLCLLLLVCAFFVYVSLYFKYDKNFEKVFEHVSLLQLPLLIIGISVPIAFVVAFGIKFTAVEIENRELIGRNYWGFKKRIPISAITQIYPFSYDGINVIVVNSSTHGEVFISSYTEKLDELVQYLEKNMDPYNV